MRPYCTYLLLLVLSVTSWGSSWKDKAGIENGLLSGSVTISSRPEAVWSILSDVSIICNVMDFRFLHGIKRFKRPGDAAVMIAGSDTGRIIMTHMKPLREIRYIFAPEDGSYVCQQEWKLVPRSDTTQVLYQVQYSEFVNVGTAGVQPAAKARFRHLERLKRFIRKGYHAIAGKFHAS